MPVYGQKGAFMWTLLSSVFNYKDKIRCSVCAWWLKKKNLNISSSDMLLKLLRAFSLRQLECIFLVLRYLGKYWSEVNHQDCDGHMWRFLANNLGIVMDGVLCHWHSGLLPRIKQLTTNWEIFCVKFFVQFFFPPWCRYRWKRGRDHVFFKYQASPRSLCGFSLFSSVQTAKAFWLAVEWGTIHCQDKDDFLWGGKKI